MQSDEQTNFFLREVAKEPMAIPADDKLKQLSSLVSQQLRIETAIKETEEQLSELKGRLAKVSENDIPELFSELGLSEFKINSGIKVTVKPFYSAKIVDTYAYEWLESHGHGGIIKGEVSVAFPKDFDKSKLNAIAQAASAIGLFAETSETVHPSTLRAWVKETIETGGELDRALFNVYVGQRTKLSV